MKSSFADGMTEEVHEGTQFPLRGGERTRRPPRGTLSSAHVNAHQTGSITDGKSDDMTKVVG